jgi:prevent-host-death family protein
VGAGTEQALGTAQRISTREWVRRPGVVMDEVLRNQVVVVQNHGRDVAAIVDIEHYRQLLDQVRRLTGQTP